MNAKISVLMGVHNARDSIRAAVLTIEEQTYSNIEYVICDDASTDGTTEILKELADNYPNIVLLFNHKNQGLAYALNRCFLNSTGSYIARMDADDICKPERFQIQMDFLKTHPEYDLVGTGMIMVDDDKRETYIRQVETPTADVLPREVPFFHPTVLMHRYVLEMLGAYSVEKYTRRCEDLELWYRFFYTEFKGYNLPDYLYIKTQGLDDYKRRKIRHGWEMFYIHIRGLRLVHAPVYKYFLAIKPVISASVPKRIMKAYHDWIFRNK